MKRFVLRAAGLLLAFATTVASAAAPQMISPVRGAVAKNAPALWPQAAPVRFNGDTLFALPAGATVELTLPNADVQSYVFERVIEHGGGIRTWIGQSPLRGNNERAVITQSDAGTWGWMKTPWGEYRIYPGSDHDWIAEKPLMNIAPTFSGGDAIPAPDDDPRIPIPKGIPTFESPFMVQKALTAKAAPAPAFVADVMILYTDDIATKLGAGLMPMLYNLVATNNLALADSEVALSLRLVNATKINLPNTAGSSDTLSSMAGSAGSNIAFFQGLSHGAGSLRDQVGADFVALVRDGPTDTGGIAFVLKNPTPGVLSSTAAHSVNNFCAGGCESIFAHELGHNQGNAHDRNTVARDSGTGTVSPTAGVFPYSFGHNFCTNGFTCDAFTPGGCPSNYAQCASRVTGVDFGTIMSYVNPTAMKFSNPNVQCVPAGGAGPSHACGQAGVNDNALSMNTVRSNVAAYRNSTIPALPGSVQFKQTRFVGTEAGGTVTFTASRTNGSTGAVSAAYVVSGVSATAGVDFIATSGTLNWANGDAADKTITVTLRNEQVVEGVESLSATLSTPAGTAGFYLGHPTVATAAILESWPPGGTFPAGFTGTSGNAWTTSADFSYDGDAVSLKSGAIQFGVNGCDANGNPSGAGTLPCPSAVQVSRTFPAGEVSFAYRVDSYPNFGVFEFLVDGVVLVSRSGNPATVADDPARPGWRTFSTTIAAGAHTLVWRYRVGFGFACSNAVPAPPQGGTCADRAWIDSVSLPVALTPSSVSVIANTPTAALGQSISFTATVNPGGAVGTVGFYDSGAVIAGCEAVAVAGATATCNTSALAVGVHSIAAGYSGNTTFAASLSTGVTQTILSTQTLTLTKAGTGAGTVTSNPAGINCGATCAFAFGGGSSVTLTAAASGGSVFAGWSGGACTGTGTCVVTMNAATAVTANFVTLAGTPTATLMPASLAFGGQSMGTTAPAQAVTVTNTGTGTLTISNLAVSNAQFAQTNNCTSLASGASCTVNVTFTPTTAAGALLSTTSVTGNLTITSNGTGSPNAAPLTGTGEKSLVTHYYRSILRRAPDGGGKAFWESEAVRLAGLQANVNETWFAMATFFYFSGEYTAFGRNDTEFVSDLYNTFFNRPADGGGLAFWTAQLTAGVPREIILVSFMFSTEFQTFAQGIFGNTAARKEVDTVVDFYRGVLSRLPDTGGFNSWVGQFRTAQCSGAGAVNTTVESISSAFMNSGEYLGRGRTNAQFVGDIYNAFLRRGGDQGGVLFWIGQLNGGATRDSIRQQFIASGEFQGRVAAIIAQGCLP